MQIDMSAAQSQNMNVVHIQNMSAAQSQNSAIHKQNMSAAK